jgi:hypothetical protein
MKKLSVPVLCANRASFCLWTENQLIDQGRMLYFAPVREAKTSRISFDVSGRIASIAMNCVIAFPLHSCSGIVPFSLYIKIVL